MRTKLLIGLVVVIAVVAAFVVIRLYQTGKLGTSADVAGSENTINYEDATTIQAGSFDGVQYLDGKIQLAPVQ